MELNSIYLHLAGLIDEAGLENIARLSNTARFEDGSKTATQAAREVKHNLQLDQGSESYMALQQIMFEALNRSSLLRSAAHPKNVQPFIFSRYTQGMNYGWHVDSPVMGNMLRSDIAITVFLNDPGEYDGGELELLAPSGPVLYKLAAGDAICYPCTQLHRVREVTRGERRVAVSWIQSMVKHAEQRKILFEINQVIESVRQRDMQSPEANLLQQAHSNLLRMWAEN